MNATTLASSQWTISLRTPGEVLTGGARGDGLEIHLLGVPRGYTPREVEGWLQDLIGVAAETTGGAADITPIPLLLHRALTGLLFSQAELWSFEGEAAPCSIAFAGFQGDAAFGWVGEADVQVWQDDQPITPAWVRVRDDEGREAKAFRFDGAQTVRVCIEWSTSPGNAHGSSATLDAEWIRATGSVPTAPSSPATLARTAGPALELTPEAESVAPIMSASAPPRFPHTLPVGQPGLLSSPSDTPVTLESVTSEFLAASSRDLIRAVVQEPTVEFEPSVPVTPDEATEDPDPASQHPSTGVMGWLKRAAFWGRKKPEASAAPELESGEESAPIASPEMPPRSVGPPRLKMASRPTSPSDAGGAPARASNASSASEPVLEPDLAVELDSLAITHTPDHGPTMESPPSLGRAPSMTPSPGVSRPQSTTPAPPRAMVTQEPQKAPAPATDPAPLALPKRLVVSSATAAPKPAARSTPRPTAPMTPAPPSLERTRAATESLRSAMAPLPAPPPQRAPSPAELEDEPLALAPQAPEPSPSELEIEPLALAPQPPEPRPVRAEIAPLPVAPSMARDSAAPKTPAAQVEPEIPWLELSQTTAPRVAPRTARTAWPAAEELAQEAAPLWKQPWFWVVLLLVLFGGGWLLGNFQNLRNAGHPSGVSGGVLGFGAARYDLAISSRPSGAWINVDGKDIARRTPASLEVSPGKHSITLTIQSLGGATYEVRGERGDKVPLDVALLGSLDVAAADATPIRVAVDGEPRGFAPLTLDSLAPGVHEVAFTGPNLAAWAQTVEVHVGQKTELVARPMSSPATGMIQVRGTITGDNGGAPLKGAPVWIDGEPRGVTPLTLELPRGPHSVRVANHGEEAPVQVIDLPGGNQRFADFEFGTGVQGPRLMLTGSAAHVRVDHPGVISATLTGLALSDVREMWLHARTPDGLWRRYQMTTLKAPDGVVGVAVFPTALIDPKTGTRYYMSATTNQGDEYFTELETAMPQAVEPHPAATTE